MTNEDIRDDMVTEYECPPANQRPPGTSLTNQRPGAIGNGNISDDRSTMNGTMDSHHQLYYVT